MTIEKEREKALRSGKRASEKTNEMKRDRKKNTESKLIDMKKRRQKVSINLNKNCQCTQSVAVSVCIYAIAK